PRKDGSNGGTFVWTKASVCHVHSQIEASHQVLSSGGHGREIKAMATTPILMKNKEGEIQYIPTGAEDTTIRIWSFNEQRDESGSTFRCLGTFGKHTTGIQQLRWSADGSLLFSAAGCEEFFVWRVQPVPFLGVGAVCEAICPQVTDNGDLRVMDFAVTEIARHPGEDQNLTERGYIVTIVYSDSSLRVFRYPSPHSGRSFLLLRTGTYTTHCLTAASYLGPDTSNILCTASSDGHIAFWPMADSLRHISAKRPHVSSTAAVHQNSIKSLVTIPLDPAGLDCLIITGGDDGALGMTRCMLSNVSTRPVTSTLLIPKAHAAAISAVEYLLGTPSKESSQTHVFVSSGNDQRIKTWIVQVTAHDTPSNSTEGLSHDQIGGCISVDPPHTSVEDRLRVAVEASDAHIAIKSSISAILWNDIKEKMDDECRYLPRDLFEHYLESIRTLVSQQISNQIQRSTLSKYKLRERSSSRLKSLTDLHCTKKLHRINLRQHRKTSASMTSVENQPGPNMVFHPGRLPHMKPLVVGVYGVSGCGKTYVLDQLKDILDSEYFSFYEGSEMVAKVTPGGLKAFQGMKEEDQLMYRQRAIDKIAHRCCKSNKVRIVAGHSMLWSETEGKALPMYTQNDLNVLTYILYLDVPSDVIAQRRSDDTGKARPILTAAQLDVWKTEEKDLLRGLCRSHGILLSTLQHPIDTQTVAALLGDFKIHSEYHNFSRAKEELEKGLTLEAGIVLAMDADKTLAPEDTGALFWTAASKKWPSVVAEDTLKTLFGGPLGYSHTAFRQAALLYDEVASDQDFAEICQHVASQVSMYPEIISLLHFMAEQDNIDLVIITSGLGLVWKKVLELEGLSDAVTVIGGGRTKDAFVITPLVKSYLVGYMREEHKKYIWAFGDSPLDLPMLNKADRAVVIVGDELTRSRTMDAALKTAINEHGLQPVQINLPNTSVPRPGLPRAQLTHPLLIYDILGREWPNSTAKVVSATDTSATRLLATPMRNCAVAGPELREAHRRVGHHLATTYVAEIIGLEQPRIQHVLGRETRGYQLRHEKKTTIVALMRGGEPMAFGVNDAFPHAMFVHAKDPQDVKMHHLEGQLTLILVDS
ncbi:MAG: hypothetical protein Q9205_007438, partial [Flavoplaca limonia]